MSDEILYSVRTAWKWKEKDFERITDSFREIESNTGTKIIYIEEKESFEIRGTAYEDLDKARDSLIKRLNSNTSTAEQVLIVSRRTPKKVDDPKPEVGLPPPLPIDKDKKEEIPLMISEEDFGLKDTFRFNRRVRNIGDVLGWNHREAFLSCDYWKDICKECKVSGDVVDERMKIHFTKGKSKDISEALKRLAQLEKNFLRPPFKYRRIPLVHYPNQFTLFKLSFYRLEHHPYFRYVVNTDLHDPYLLVSATKDPLTQKYVLPAELLSDPSFQRENYSSDNDQYNRMQLQWQENNRETERAAKGKAKAVSPTNNNYSSSSRSKPITPEEPQHNWGTIQRPTEILWPSDVPDSNSSTDFPALSSQNRRINKGNYSERTQPSPFENQSQTLDEWPRLSEEERLARKDTKKHMITEMRKHASYNNNDQQSLIDFQNDDYVHEEKINDPKLKPFTKQNIMQKNPNNSNNSPPTPGKMVRDYNFNQMKNVLEEGLEYVRGYKGEIRFYGSLGKALFTKVDKKVKNELWEFTDLKDVLVSEHGVCPNFSEIATTDDGLIEAFIEVLGSKPSNKSAYYEIQAEARNAPHGDYSNVYMYVNMGFVSLEKVMLDWEPLVNIDWTILDRKTDFSMILATRRAIRHDVRPFTTFIKKTSVTPNNRVITYEQVRDFLNVTNINFKQVTKFKLHHPFVAEVARVEKLPLVEQPNSNKMQGKPGQGGDVHYTIEIYSEVHREAFKQNSSIGSGEIAKWTVGDILEKEKNHKNLVEFVKAMLLLVERCHKAAEKRLNQPAENQETEDTP